MRGDVIFANTDLTRNGDIVGSPLKLPKLGFSKHTLFSMDLSKIELKEDRADLSFFYYWLSLPYVKRFMVNASAASTVLHLHTNSVLKLKGILPPLPEQKKIAKILSSVDEVFETTENQINKLKDLKKGMMNELLTQGIGHTEFKDSPVGRIPVEWESVELGSVTILARGKFSHRPRNDPKFYGGNIPFIQTGDVPKESPFIDKYSQTLNEQGKEISKLFSKGTLVITIAATIGEIGILKFDSCFPDSLIGISVDTSKTVSGFILYVMRFHKDTLSSYAPQTAQKNINLEILSPFLIPLPPLKEQQKIAKTLAAIDTNIEQKQNKLIQSMNLKKSLMADLLTGRVRVKLNEHQESL